MRGRRSRATALVFLPAQPNPLIGRERELAALRELLTRPSVRMVTVCGPAGTGKTRLAVAAAAEQPRASSADGVWFVDLAPIHEPHLVPTAIGRAIGLRELRGELAQARLQRHIGEHEIALLLDNFEQVLEASAGLAELLVACPNLRLLVTSRAPLHLRWEHVFRVGPLELQTAAALYVERARAVDPSFALTPVLDRELAELCRQLDGLPLAIELAAARSDVYTPAEVLRRLRLDRLAGGARDLPPRQQSLAAAFDWSYDLLSTADQAAFRAVSVCVGGFSPETALAVAGTDDLGRLVQHSLLRRDPEQPARFRMLETVRAYAFERLQHAGEAEAVQTRHARVLIELVEGAAPELLGPRQATWLGRLEREHDNLTAALRFCVAARETELALRLARGLWRFWWLHGHLSEGMDLLDAVLAHSADIAESLAPIRAVVLNGAGVMAHVRGEYARAADLLSQSLTISRQLNSQSGMAAALHNLGALARERGDVAQARAAYEQSLQLERQGGTPWGIGMSLINLGALAADQGDAAHATELLDESLAIFREIGDGRGIAAAQDNLAGVARDRGDWAAAADLHAQSLARSRELGDRWGTAAGLCDLARAVEHRGDWRRAAGLLTESLALYAELGLRQGTATCLEVAGSVLIAAERCSDAARLVGAAEVLHERIGAPGTARDGRERSVIMGQLRSALGGRALYAALEEGRRLVTDSAGDSAAAEATRLLARVARTDPTAAAANSGLSPREAQVAALIADGLSNRQIADRLVISERTADRHVSNILGKLGLKSRAQVAAWATRSGSGGHNAAE
ncbi:MAG: tetratricopeptide repeat protein [Chloroflexi bacterium]|nr:tetratricopeptide repeat protein [Chloroflexota bacterium]